MVVTIQNPRVTATADLQMADGTSLSVTVPRDASEETILSAVRTQLTAESLRRAASGQPFRIPTDEELVPALSAFGRMAGTPRDIE